MMTLAIFVMLGMGSPGRGGEVLDCLGDFDSPRAEASVGEVPMVTMMYYNLKGGACRVWGG